jgi:nucleotide-binding universal stress UspA family protein
MYNKMLVTLDGSNLSEVVFTYAQELSSRLNVNLELLNVCRPEESDRLPMHQAYVEHMAEKLQKKAGAISSKKGKTTQGKETQIEGKVAVGYPAEEILKYTDENRIDLIMIASHGRSGIRRWTLGSVADKVIHSARIPIWLVPSHLREEVIWDKLPKRRVVIPFYGPKPLTGVISHAINTVKQREGVEFEIILLYIDPFVTQKGMTEEQRKFIEASHITMSKFLDEQTKRISKEGIPTRFEILSGDPVLTIINFLTKNQSHLLCLSTPDLPGIKGMIFDSVTEGLVRMIQKTPMLLVRSTE